MSGSGKGDWKRSEVSRPTNLVYHNTSLIAYSTKLTNRYASRNGMSTAFTARPTLANE